MKLLLSFQRFAPAEFLFRDARFFIELDAYKNSALARQVAIKSQIADLHSESIFGGNYRCARKLSEPQKPDSRIGGLRIAQCQRVGWLVKITARSEENGRPSITGTRASCSVSVVVTTPTQINGFAPSG